MSAESIWSVNPSLEMVNSWNQNTIGSLIGLEITEIGPDFIKGTMPADHRTFQPTGRVHGGAYIVLAETLGSIGANLVVDVSKYYCVGQEVNANHLRGVKSGMVTAVAKPVHTGRTTHVWSIELRDDEDKMCCISRLTVAVVPIERA